MYKFTTLKEKVFETITDSQVKWTEGELLKLSRAIVVIMDINRISEEEGLLFIDDAVKEVDETTPNKELLLEAVSIRQNAKDFDEFIVEKQACIPKGVDAAILYVYILGAYFLQEMDEDEFYNDITSFIPLYKMKLMNSIYKSNLSEKNSLLTVDCMTMFFTVDIYADDEVFESYIKATCDELKELTDPDILLLYKKDSRKFNDFLEYADKDFRCRLLRLVNSSELKIKALTLGKTFLGSCEGDGKVKIHSMNKSVNLVMDIHEIIYDTYLAEELEGGSDRILHPEIKERNMNDELINMGF